MRTRVDTNTVVAGVAMIGYLLIIVGVALIWGVPSAVLVAGVVAFVLAVASLTMPG